MAIEDYYIDLHYVELVKEPDETGGFEYFYTIGKTFKGSAVRSSASEQQVAGIRGVLDEQFNVTTAKGNPLKKDDIIMFEDEDEGMVFLRVNSNPLRVPKNSNQNFKGVTATKIIPDYEVI